MTAIRFLCCVTLLLIALSAGAAELRPLAGKGVLVIPSGDLLSDELTLYEFPGVRSKGNYSLKRLAQLTQAVSLKPGDVALAVGAVRDGCVKVGIGLAGDDGWLELRPDWRYFPWERFLTGRTVRLVPGLRETATRIRQEPAETGAAAGAASPGFSLTVREVRDDWAQVQSGETVLGWLRWRDGDGRMLVIVE